MDLLLILMIVSIWSATFQVESIYGKVTPPYYGKDS